MEDRNIITICSAILVVILQTVQVTIVYYKMKVKLDSIAKSCLTIADMERWSRSLDDRNGDLKVPDITEFVLRRRSLEQQEKES